MTFPTPLGLFRFEPLRWLRRLWVWLDCPPECKEIIWSHVEQRDLQIRSLSDGELLVGTARFRGEADTKLGQAFLLEERRRGLKPNKLLMLALITAYPDKGRMALAERLFTLENA